VAERWRKVVDDAYIREPEQGGKSCDNERCSNDSDSSCRLGQLGKTKTGCTFVDLKRRDKYGIDMHHQNEHTDRQGQDRSDGEKDERREGQRPGDGVLARKEAIFYEEITN
jgi:hypothetical protein